MKVLDPFAGYRLASGHPIFHLSLFCGSFVATHFGTDALEIVNDSFYLLRWAHFLLFSLAICSGIAKIDSAAREDDDTEKGQYRDSIYKIFGRVCDTLAVFMYQACIFYVQMNISNVASVCVTESDGTGIDCSLGAPKSNLMAWLYIEMYCFYLYMASAIVYIVYHQMVEGVCCKKQESESDMAKTITDFLEYAYPNIIWFAFNFVLVMMPLVCLVKLNPNAENLDIDGNSRSYTVLMIVVCIANLVQFLLRPQIYHIKKKTRLYKEAKDAGGTGADSAPAPAKTGLGGMLGALKKKKDDKAPEYQLEKDLIKGDRHYVWMEFVFNGERLWVWWINLAAYVAVVITYFCMPGHEIIYSMYLPLDMLINLSKAVYFFWNYFFDLQAKKKKEELV